VINLPDISLTPDVKNEGTKTDIAAKQFVYMVNTALQAQIPFYRSFLGVAVLLIDVNTPFTQLVNTRTWTVKGLGTVNFVNSSGFAYNPRSGALAQNPNGFVFWDGFHPTAAVHYLAGWFIFQSAFPGTSSVPVAK
jgi:phospholipase/lecithinase/hemolysin